MTDNNTTEKGLIVDTGLYGIPPPLKVHKERQKNKKTTTRNMPIESVYN